MATQDSNAKEFFNTIQALKEQSNNQAYTFLDAIPNRFQTDPFFEQEWIDFKGQPQSDINTREIWSKALSGFANLTDGIIVWGIDARPTGLRKIDAASGLRLIDDTASFESKLRDWIRDATIPPVIGVDYLSCTGPDGKGFVVSLIPLSTHKPHRAEWSKEPRQYYFRAGDDFLVADPAMLRMLFYPKYDHNIYIDTHLTFGMKQLSHGIGQGYLVLEAFITNAGNASAYEPFVAITNNGADIFDNVGRQWLRPSDRWTPIPSPPPRPESSVIFGPLG